MLSTLRLFDVGALALTSEGLDYSSRHQEAGFSRPEWELLTQPHYWAPHQARQVPTILAESLSISLTVAGLPPTQLPVHYVAVVICRLVAVCNRVTACYKAPRAYDTVAASGLNGSVEIKDAPPQQLLALVLAYSSGTIIDLPGQDLSEMVDKYRQDQDKRQLDLMAREVKS